MSSCVLVIDYASRVARPAGTFNDFGEKCDWPPNMRHRARQNG